MGVTAVRLLISLGLLVNVVQAQNCSKPLGGPNMDIKGSDILSDTFADGSQVTFECNIGYVSKGGSRSVTCTKGVWSLLGMKCERRNCGSAGEVENGNVEYHNGTEFGDKAVAVCNTGFRQVGKGTLRCEAQGWMGRFPVCEAVVCESPPVVVDGTFSPDKETYVYNDVIQYTCKRDYTLAGKRQLACTEDGTFQPNPPKCIKVKCEEPEIPNGFRTSSGPPYGYLYTVTLECRSGYRMNGSATQKCNINSQWEPGVPNCIEVTCEEPKILNGFRTSSDPPYGYLSRVTFECIPGYKIMGSATQKCDLNGQWEPGLPKCIAIPKTTSTTSTTTTTPRIPPVADHCVDPKTINPQVTVSRQPPYRLLDQVTVSCPSGDKQVRQSTITCGQSGVWDPEIPKCEPDNGGGVTKAVIITVVVVIIGGILACLGMYCFGVPPFSKKKGTRRGNTDTEATNEGEDVALS